VTERRLARLTGISHLTFTTSSMGFEVCPPTMADLLLRAAQITVLDLLSAQDWRLRPNRWRRQRQN